MGSYKKHYAVTFLLRLVEGLLQIEMKFESINLRLFKSINNSANSCLIAIELFLAFSTD